MSVYHFGHDSSFIYETFTVVNTDVIYYKVVYNQVEYARAMVDLTTGFVTLLKK
jgi:hypothetical protein